MKTLHYPIIAGIAIMIMLAFTYVTLTTHHSSVPIGTGPIEVKPQINNITNVSTVIIPNDSENARSVKNYEPTYLVVVLGINNTVRWVNQEEIMNFIAADNQNDPNFFDATSKQTYLNVQEDNNVNPPNFLRPGESFEYTFTKSGYFGYHGTHQWQHGWILVLPESATSVTTTVTLNDSNVLGPCEIFALPCPQGPHIFTAQQFGSDIYIEKMTVNGVDNYVIVKPEGFCVYPSSHSNHSCTNPDDLAILRLIGVDTQVPQEDINVSIKDMASSYLVGEPIDFGIEINGYGHCDFPSVLLIHDGIIVWQSKTSLVSCAFTSSQIHDKYTMRDLGGPFSLNQTGRYTVHVGYDSNSTEMQFNVISSAGLSQTNHIAYTKNNNPFGIISLVIYSPPAACLGPCGPYDFHLKISANSTAYLLGYNICDGDSCTKRNDLSILLPITDMLRPDFAMIGLPEDLKWKFGDAINIQLEVSSTPDNKTASLLDLGNSTIVH